MQTQSRRHFLRTAAALSLGFTGLHTFAGCAVVRPTRPLVSDPSGLLDLPAGFRYTAFSRVGERMDDGFLVPHRHDGMAAFPGPDGLTVLVRNHEVNADAPATEGAFHGDPSRIASLNEASVYDLGRQGQPALGGTTTLVYDTRTQQLVGSHLSLAGTIRNCAGGPTPWQTWITCEETTERAGAQWRLDHGYNFEVPASAQPGLTAPVPLRAMGRFNHEAVAVHPATSIVYQTEDRNDGLIYRFIPTTPERLQDGGRLQALVVRDAPSLDTRNWETSAVGVGQRLAVQWLDMDEVDAPEDDLRLRGFNAGAARFARGEGMWYGNEAVYFACTNGGQNRKGQVWKYTASPYEGTPREAEQPATLELFIEPNDITIVENCDNLTVAPWGDLILCEDADTDQNLVGVTPEGECYRFARNARGTSELAGVTFSPDGSTLFVNVQHDGVTLAITGPWPRRS